MQGLILLNKTEGITSYGAVSVIKRLCGEKRVGHTGTLDPMATGVLPVLIGKATALSSYMLDADKKYIATVKLGVVTDTEDITGNVIKTSDFNVSDDEISKVLSKFTGTLMQRPPMYSAIKKDGIPMYELARKGETRDIPERQITVYSAKVVEKLNSDGMFKAEFFVSKGTYIRSLVRDIGEELGCGATLAALCRTTASGIDISECVSLDELNEQNITDYILNEEKAMAHLRGIYVSENQAVRFSNGGELDFKRLKTGDFADGELVRIKLMNNNIFLGLGCADVNKGQLKVKCVINYPKEENAVALGTFDGVHLGHRKVLEMPDCYKKIAVCFETPPKMLINGEKKLLTQQPKKEAILKKIGIDEVYALDFNEIRDYEPQEFLKFLKEKFSPKVISCGFNYRFGKGALGNCDTIREFAEQNGIKFMCAKEVKRNGEIISSTAIRQLLKNGEVNAANRLLSENFSFTSKVISGDKRGRTIGFPTINQEYPKDLTDLKFGVYKTKVIFDNKSYEGITNIGKRPTYPSDFIISETYIKDFSGDLYEKFVTIMPIEFLREEIKFGSLEELKKQIEIDIQ